MSHKMIIRCLPKFTMFSTDNTYFFLYIFVFNFRIIIFVTMYFSCFLYEHGFCFFKCFLLDLNRAGALLELLEFVRILFNARKMFMS